MNTPEVSECPVLKELKPLIIYFPSLEDPKFNECHERLGSRERKCKKHSRKERQWEAKKLWGDFKHMKKCPNDDEFYISVERFLTLIHCTGHYEKKVLERFSDWKQTRKADMAYASSETSLPGTPGTPEQSSLFESSFEGGVTPFSSPPAEDDTPRTPSKSPSSDIYSFIEDTPSKIVDQSPIFIKAEEEPAIEDVNTKNESIITINATSTTLDTYPDTGKSNTVVESITEIKVASSSEPANGIPIVSTKEVVVEQASTVVVEKTIAPQNDPLVGKDPISQQGVYVAGLGYSLPKRTGSLRDDSPIIREFYKCLTSDQQKEGRVYVLKHNEHDDIFKIGFTKITASERNLQSKNCYGKNTEILYESRTPFPGAMKAERLAHVSLKNESLHITHCNMCGHGHTEWFRGSRTTILDTVKLMEAFVSFPAYEPRDGKMKLSSVGGLMIKTICDFSNKNLETAMTKYKESSRIEFDSGKSIETNVITAAQITVSEVAAEVPLESIEHEEQSSQEAALRLTDIKLPNPSMGTKLGRLIGGARKSIDHMKDKIQHVRSREITPESDSAQDELDTWRRAEELMAGLLWGIVPENSKPENCFREDKGPREWSSLKNALEQTVAKFKEDFKRAAKAEDDASNAL
ncbi:hypothetical protein FSARC_10984 [Fusarium sarcochroum]|uniref:Bacteriophage T5 Orf172 DNA-binding domain-containing protein n=1 Tax=Fusarium sarcochroum TaxID=1208366 RepID=A0A8H4X260_9HYPO|nr:hypothetical protein FSARC_10984 [Fusarium sarcochroum]